MRTRNPFLWLPLWLLAIPPAYPQPPAAQPAPNRATNPARNSAASQPVHSAAHSAIVPASPSAQTKSGSAPAPTPEEIADALEARQHYQAALAAYAKIPNPSAAIWNKMGVAYQMMLNAKAATRCYKQSLGMDSRNAMVYNNLGTVYGSLQDYSKAERMYREALRIDPRSPLILKNLGTDLLLQHKYKRGWRAYEQALKLDPHIFEDNDNPTVSDPTSIEQRGMMNYFMARGCVRMGQIGCAIEYLRMAISEGYTTIKKISEDADFASLRKTPEFKALKAEEKSKRRR